MAEFRQNTIENCGEPEDPGGPYLAECYYEYVAFLDCSSDGTYSDPEIDMGKEAYGVISTYSAGGREMFGDTLGQKGFSPYEIKGTPYSEPIFVGLMSTDWHNWFFDNGRHFFNGEWHYAQNHNHFDYNFRYKMAKFFVRTKTWVTQEMLDNGWRCTPTPEDGSFPPAVTRDDWIRMGAECPPYYKLSACTDCQGQKQNLDDYFFEMKDGGEFNNTIIEYPLDSNKCYDLQKLQFGPRNQSNYARFGSMFMAGESLANEGTNYETSNDCLECKSNYILAISIDSAVNQYPGAASSLINEPNPFNTTIMYNAIAAGKMQIAYMKKDDPANQIFKGMWGNEFSYMGADGLCRRVTFFDRTLGNIQGCVPQFLAEWAKIYKDASGPQAGVIRYHNDGTSFFIHSSAFLSRSLSKDICDCKEAGGTVSRRTQIDCDQPDPRPSITGPSDAAVQVTKNNPTKGVTFSAAINTQGTNCSYTWYINGSAASQGQISSSGVITLTRTANINDNGAQVYIVVTNQGNTVTSRSAVLVVSDEPECLYCGEEVYTFTVDTYCFSNQAEANKLRVGPGRITLPTNEHKVGTRKMYAVPSMTSSQIKNRWWLIQGSGPNCSGRYTILRAKGTPIKEKWEDLPNSMKGIQQPSGDETFDRNYGIRNAGKTSTDAKADWPVDMNIM